MFFCPECEYAKLIPADSETSWGSDFFLCPTCEKTWVGNYDQGTVVEYVGQDVDVDTIIYSSGPRRNKLGLRFQIQTEEDVDSEDFKREN